MRTSWRNVGSATEYVLVPTGIGADAVLYGRGSRLTERLWRGWSGWRCCPPGTGALKRYRRRLPDSFMRRRRWRRWGVRYGRNRVRVDEKLLLFSHFVLSKRQRCNTELASFEAGDALEQQAASVLFRCNTVHGGVF
jgi:hypothetical protein